MKNKIALLAFILLFHGLIFGMDHFSSADTTNFIGKELLTRPADKSVNINFVPEKNIEAFVEYGTAKGNYPFKSTVVQANGTVPANIVLNNLQQGTKYYYHLKYKLSGAADYVTRNDFSFTTQKAKGKSFSFAVEADPHMDNNTDPELFKLTLLNVLNSGSDFLIDLGDSFMSEKESVKSRETVLQRHLLFRTYYDVACNTVPLYLVLGNHEGEQGKENDGTENCLPVWASNTRKQYYPNPIPDGFYSGCTKEEPFVGLRQSYYSYEWGDALFVVIDPYWYSPGGKDNWRFTLGKDQYEWFKKVLESSKAKFKFVFCHQIVGGKDTQGRGGSDYAQYYEMGGQNLDGSWGFNTLRPGWELPIHQLMAKNKVNIFFHGHDHFYVKQEKDGVIYQLVPQPGYPGSKSTDNAADYGYLTGTMLPSSGFLKITVADSTAKIDYVRSYLPSMETSQKKNGMIDFSYTVKPGSNITSVEKKSELPTTTRLFQNYPNPFNPETVITYEIRSAGNVSLKVFDVLGKEVATLVNEFKQPGYYKAKFLLPNNSLASGIYFYRLTTNSFFDTKKMIYQK